MGYFLVAALTSLSLHVVAFKWVDNNSGGREEGKVDIKGVGRIATTTYS